MSMAFFCWMMMCPVEYSHSITLSADENSSRFHDVVAAMIIKIADYTYWPEGRDPAKGDEITLAVLSEDKQILNVFLRSVHNRKVGKVIWKVKQVTSLSEAEGYSILFVDDHHKTGGQEWYARFHDRGILTFGEGENANCMFNFILLNGQVRFDLDLNAAKSAGMGFDSRMIKLARQLKKGANP